MTFYNVCNLFLRFSALHTYLKGKLYKIKYFGIKWDILFYTNQQPVHDFL